MHDEKRIRSEFEAHCTFLQQELKGLRTGRASAALVEDITVEAYGTMTPLQHLASLSIPDAKTILITPWDKSILKDIEKALTLANLGINPVNDGAGIRLTLPAMTEETRKNLIKIVGQKVEHAKIAIRTQRDKVKEEILKEERAGTLTEDDRFSHLKKLDETTREFTDRAAALGTEKEKEVMTI